MNNGVYKIINTINDKIYIGSCSYERGFENRWQIPYNRYLERSFKKYGRDKFKFEILWLCEPKDCLYFEQLYLDYYEPWIETGKGYNICKIAGSTKGRKLSQETKDKISIGNKGKRKSVQHCANIKKSYIPKPLEKIDEILLKCNRPRKPIERIDMKTGEVKEYNSIQSARKDNFNPGHIHDCCNNKRQSHKSFYWQFLAIEPLQVIHAPH